MNNARGASETSALLFIIIRFLPVIISPEVEVLLLEDGEVLVGEEVDESGARARDWF